MPYRTYIYLNDVILILHLPYPMLGGRQTRQAYD